MRLASRSRLALCSLILLAAACRGGNGDDTGDDTGDDAPGDDTPIYQIQDPNPATTVPVGTVVTLRGVVVTAIDNYGERADGGRKGNIWVQEPDGGPYSGVLVYNAPVDQVATLAIGDLIDLSGAEKVEFALDFETTDRTTTELQPPVGGQISITKISSGTPPAPAAVDALAIAMMDQAGKDVEWEKWEGVLIQVMNVAQISTVGSITAEDPNFRRFRVTGGLELDTSLSPFPDTATVNTCYASITGVGDYFLNHKLLIREQSALVGGGTGCPAPEEGDAACADGTDNDYDSFVDCADFSCQATSAACVTTTTIADIQMGNATGAVVVEDAVVVAIAFNERDLWVSDSLTAAPYNSVLVFRGQLADLPAEIVVGATVDLAGVVDEFNNGSSGTGTLTEIKPMGTSEVVTFVAAPAGTPTPLEATGMIATLVDETAGEPYEGLLVELENVEITLAGSADNFWTGRMAIGSTTFASDDDILRLMDPVGTCYASVLGIWTYQVYEDMFGLLPISTTPGGDCN